MGALFGIIIGATVMYYSITGTVFVIGYIWRLLHNNFSFRAVNEEIWISNEELREEKEQARRAWEQKQRKL